MDLPMTTLRPKILLVDDVDFFLELEKDFLKRTAADILTARNGQQALEIIRRERPNLVYMDVNMPVMDGLSCCKAVKGDPTLRDIPIIMVYATSKEVDNAACAAAGSNGILNKPVDRAAFLDLGRKFLFAIERREKRIPCQMTVTFKIDNEEFQGIGLDISPNGVYIQYRQNVQPESRISVSFYLPTISGDLIETRGRIAWVNQGFPRKDLTVPQGFGVQFTSLAPGPLSIIRRYVEQLESAAPSPLTGR